MSSNGWGTHTHCTGIHTVQGSISERLGEYLHLLRHTSKTYHSLSALARLNYARDKNESKYLRGGGGESSCPIPLFAQHPRGYLLQSGKRVETQRLDMAEEEEEEMRAENIPGDGSEITGNVFSFGLCD